MVECITGQKQFSLNMQVKTSCDNKHVVLGNEGSEPYAFPPRTFEKLFTGFRNNFLNTLIVYEKDQEKEKRANAFFQTTFLYKCSPRIIVALKQVPHSDKFCNSLNTM